MSVCQYFPKCRVLLNEEVSPSYFLMMTEVPTDFTFVPGQFLMVKISDALDPLLGRPMAILSVEEGKLLFLYRNSGKGTGALSFLRKNGSLDIWGPLGNGFMLPQSGDLILVAGGIGMPSLYPLAERFCRQRRSSQGIVFFYGGKSAGHILFQEKIERFVEKIFIATEDGSLGERGLITTPLQRFLTEKRGVMFTVATCGPRVMMKAVADTCFKAKIPCEASLEEFMACGVGVCLGCVWDVKAPQGGIQKVRLCVEGPVLKAETLLWQNQNEKRA